MQGRLPRYNLFAIYKNETKNGKTEFLAIGGWRLCIEYGYWTGRVNVGFAMWGHKNIAKNEGPKHEKDILEMASVC